jgi:hypothetical protein
MRVVLPAPLFLSSACAHSATEPQSRPVAAPARVPVADHHLHLFSPASAALFTPPFLPAIALPAGLAEIVQERLSLDSERETRRQRGPCGIVRNDQNVGRERRAGRISVTVVTGCRQSVAIQEAADAGRAFRPEPRFGSEA